MQIRNLETSARKSRNLEYGNLGRANLEIWHLGACQFGNLEFGGVLIHIESAERPGQSEHYEHQSGSGLVLIAKPLGPIRCPRAYHGIM